MLENLMRVRPQVQAPLEQIRQRVAPETVRFVTTVVTRASDFAEEAALSLLRLARKRPLLAASLIAASAGALVGMAVAGLTTRPRAVPAGERVLRAVQQRAATIRQRAVSTVPAVSLPLVGRVGGVRWRLARAAAPLGFRLMRYPMVRGLIWRAAVAGIKRRFRR